MNLNTEKQRLTSLLSLKSAPQGKIEGDFRVALYAVAALYQLDFSKNSNFGLCASLLGSLGFKGDVSRYKVEDYYNTLDDLVAKGSLVQICDKKVYAVPSEVKIITAKVRAVENPLLKGIDDVKHYSYVISDETGKEYHLNTDLVIMPNDEVEAVITKSSDVAFVKNLTKVRQCVLGRIMLFGKKKASLMPDEANLKEMFFDFASDSDLGEAKSGDVVIAQIVKRVGLNRFLVKTREVVKDIGNLNNIIVMAVLRNDIPHIWPDNLIKSLSRIPNEVSAKDIHGRVDLRDIPLVTIDGEDARDFDDAVYCKKEGTGWRLFVSIADVSYYVKPGTLLDKEAVNRCNSCYFPNFVIPMLPEKLSNGICSLNPDVDRLCMTCEMVISKVGKIESYKFYPAVMRSHARLTYTEAWQMISEGTVIFEEHKSVMDDVKELYNLYQAFKKDRRNRGGISVESEELHFVFNENMEIEGVKPLERNDAHKLIEECMIAANVAAATFVAEHQAQTLYRVHAKPMEKKLGLLVNQLARFGLSLKGGDSPTSKDYMMLADSVAGREDAKIINELILRSMSKAEYSPDNIGHFGLALEKYAHFTSPIRRYADLQLHRVIKYLLEKEQKHDWGRIGSRSYTKAELVALGVKCTDREIAADTAEHEVDGTLACIYMEKFIGEVVNGTVTACTKFGVFVHLDDYGVDGMIYIGNFDSYMSFDERTQTLVSNRGEVYAVGKKIRVVVSGVNEEEHKIDLRPDTMSKKELMYLKKERDSLVAKREKISQNAPHSDKEKILKNLADISSARVASDEDKVQRKVAKKGNSASLEKEYISNPYGTAVNMGQIKFPKKGKKKSKSKKGKK
ncbi:MAG: ribonuclease R [Succinivibrio sp.]|nr:ribonuclease R [Succinivibrio sp.]